MDIFQALDAVWAARWPILEGVVNTLIISGVAIFLGTVLGVMVGLLLTF
jgi:polar amino acid transport system permease protein